MGFFRNGLCHSSDPSRNSNLFILWIGQGAPWLIATTEKNSGHIWSYRVV